MKRANLFKRLSCLIVVFAILASFVVPAYAVDDVKLTFEKVDNSSVSAQIPGREQAELNEEDEYADDDEVRVSIYLEKAATIEAGYSVKNIALNSAAMNYRAGLQKEQDTMVAKIEKATKEDLDVVWNLTLAANLISANVKYGQIETIEKIPGVEEVLIETRYEPDVASTGPADPNMATSGKQIGSAVAWAAGYTGAGSRIAIIDTGTDTDHQSFNATAFEYSLGNLAGKAGMTPDEYKASLDLLDAEEINAVAEHLNAPVTGEDAYINSKLPFGYNYIDKSLTVHHDNDSQGSHGSHVAGIATANAYIYTGEGFVPALESAMVQGVAPDAQLITMKVFGKAGGAYPADYMAAIEDAIVLGCDAANLSLGSGNPGTSREAEEKFQAILESLTEAGIVVAMSAGNSGYWAENAYNVGYLYAEDVSMQTNGSPGSYTNSMSVASVDNDGATGLYISVDGQMIIYNEMLEGQTGAYSNLPFSTIAGEQEYVFIDGLGTEEDWAAVGEALEGKIALCSRGEISFFEKAQYAVEAGAIGTFIYNNQSGVINMDLSDYPYTQPCASLTQADGAAIKAASTPVTDDAGNVLYYTGTMTISETMGAGQYNSDFYTMSSFSSWGVPGSLEMKPEITAPGGNIYSVNGVAKDGKSYEVMSGTSMASPQVAGMAAIVAQYIRENGLEAKTGLSARQLAQSLLMSTAEPMLANASGYHSVMQQGAGLANVGAAVTADSYITMADGSNAGAADGKVKVELGDDPARTGAYTATFTINNLTDEEKAFDLGADFFIQAPISDGVNMYMYTATALIGADVTWMVNGSEVVPTGNYAGCDYNGDGVVNSDDGQALLDYATGVRTELTNIDKADLDADKDIDSYDAYLFLKGLNESVAVVPANGSVEVTVDFSLSASWKATLDYYYPNGTYLQGYIYAESLSTEEGVAGTCHSIPVLGFFGNWTEASMYDVGSYAEYAAGDETRMPYLGDPEANTFLVTYANEPGAKYVFGGNPLVPDATYMPERNAINSADMISGVSFIAIRNASASKFAAVNETTGEVLVEAEPGAVSSAYYYVNGGYWRNTGYTLNTQVTPGSASEGDVISMGLTLAPEYYVDAEGNVDWNALGDGATFGTTMVVDNTAPELKDVTLSFMSNNMTVTASDNEYIAAVALYNKAGTRLLAYDGAKQDIAKGETAEYTMSMDGVNGKKFLLQVVDYAMNTTTYVLEMQIGGEVELPEMIAFDLDNNYWTSFTKETTYEELAEYAPSAYTYYAGTIVDHIVFASTDSGELHVMPESDLTDVTVVANMGAVVTDMAYNKADGNLYGVASGYLVEIDKLTGEITVVGKIGVQTNTLACDANGTFYCNGYGTGAVYSFTLDTLDAPEIVVEDVGIASQYVQAMEINPNNGKLYWTSCYVDRYVYAYLFEVDPATGSFTRYNDLWVELSALLIPETATGGDWATPTEDITGMQISAEAVSILRGNSVELTASVLPWTVTDRTVTWTSADEAVAVVDQNGMVTGVGEGTTTVTATSNLDPSFSATCEVTVTALEITVNGTLQDAEGNPMFYSWNMEEDATWTDGVAIDTSMTSATVDTINNKAYIMDAVAGSWSMHKVNPATGESEEVGANGAAVPLWDMEYSSWLSTADAPMLHGVYYYYFLPAKDPMALDTSAFGLQSYLANYSGASYLTAITSAGYYPFEENDGSITDTELVIMLDNAGYLWYFWIYPTESGFSAKLNFVPTDLVSKYNVAFPGYGDDMYCSMVVGEDGNLYLSAFNGDTNELFCLTLDDAGEMYNATRIGDVGQDVWPATITSVTVNNASGADSIAVPKATMKMDAVTVSVEELETITFSGTASKPAPVGNEAKVAGSYNKAAKAEAVAAEAAESVAAAAPKTYTLQSANRGNLYMPMSTTSVSKSDVDGDITLTVAAKDVEGADVASTNGVATVTYTDNLTLVGVEVNGEYTSVNEKTGEVIFGYVELDSFAAGETIATLYFDVDNDAQGEDVITVSHDEVGNVVGGTEEFVITHEPGETDPEETEPEETEPEETEPEETEPETTEPEATEPETTEPEATEPEATEPKPTKPAGDNDSADTGDAFSAMWMLVMMISMAGAMALVINRKKFLG